MDSEKIVILSASEGSAFLSRRKKQILRFAQDDKQRSTISKGDADAEFGGGS